MSLHSADLVGWLENVWRHRSRTTVKPPSGAPIEPRPDPAEPGRPYHRSTLLALGLPWGAHTGATPTFAYHGFVLPLTEVLSTPTIWNHLIYAHMIESTHVFEVFRAVLRETMHGERLGIPTEGAQWWLRTTEDLFFRTPSPFQISSVRGDLRPYDSGVRRNAYHRMFGMELPHRAEEGAPEFVKAQTFNQQFITVFEEFLREVWIGIENVENSAGSNPTDQAKIADLAERLHDMLMARRQFGNLGREEFIAIAAASWFHLSVESGFVWGASGNSSPIVDFLRAEAFGAEERLAKISQRVGVPVHTRSKSFFEIADAISELLIEIELGDYNSNNVENVRALYTPGPSLAEQRMRLIIRHWALLTGRDPKAKKQTPVPAPMEASATGNGNGAQAGYLASSLR
jgi:hypothetical protein